MFWKGPVFTKDGFTGKGIDLETCSIADALDGEEDGIIVPLFRNCHTHLGDTLARDEVPESLALAELVGPSGWKHKWLETNPAEASILAGMQEIIASGTGLVMDFREGGKAGLNVFPEMEYPGTLILLGRPEENEGLPGDNAGISSLTDVGDMAVEMVQQSRKRNGLVGIHHSENEHEEIQAIIDLKPDFLVHMCHATDDDLEAVRSAGISIVVCPRSNSYFGNLPPLTKMLELGIDVGFGTDNGMLCTANILDEIRFVRQEFDLVDLQQILSIACFGLDDMFNKDRTSTYSNLDQSGWVLLSRAAKDNFESVFSPNAEILGVRWRN
jgi:cytosine/adenosine deaminase-related metal-dependent hydrolase